MSNSLAIAATTATLRNLLQSAITAEAGGVAVTTRSPAAAKEFTAEDGAARLNLFLFQTQWNPAWRNQEIPRSVRPNETGIPPMALDLSYLLTVYEKTDGTQELLGHRLLGRAMRALHDHPLLSASEIKAALEGIALPEPSDLHDQVERIRITPLPLTLEEMSKLWTTFQTEYRASVAYQVSVILIESRRPTRTPLPVLYRGPGDAGIIAQPSLLPPYPTLLEVKLPNGQRELEPGEAFTLAGHHLAGDTVEVRYSSARLEEPRTESAAGTDASVTATFPDEPTELPAGFYTVAVIVQRAGQADRATNELSLPLAPVIEDHDPETAAAGDLTVTITCRPEIAPGQRVSLLFGDREVSFGPVTAATDELEFELTDVGVGRYYLRLRVDGVDSRLEVDSDPTSPTHRQFISASVNVT